VPDLVWKANTVSATDQRTVGELLADSDASAHETFLDATLNNAPLRVRSWNQRAESAPELWVLPSEPDSPSWPNPMERPRVVGEAIGRCVTAGHWPARVTDRRTPKPDRRQPLSRAASGRARRSPCPVGNLGSGGQYPTPRPDVHTCRSFGQPQPSQSSEGRASRVSVANPQARGGRVLDTQFGGHRNSVGEAEVPITEEKKGSRSWGRSPRRPFGPCGNVAAAMALLSLSRTQIHELIPSPQRFKHVGLSPYASRRAPRKRLQMSAVSSCYPPALSSNHAQGQLAGRQTQPPTGRKMMITPRSTVKSDVVPLMYRVDEAAAALRLSRSSVYELIRSGQLRSVKQGRRRLVPVTALADYVASLGGAA